MGNKAFRCEIRTIEVAPCQVDSAYAQFCGDSYGHWLQVPIQQIDLRIGNGMTYRHTFSCGQAPMVG